jgi:hypothetical protein
MPFIHRPDLLIMGYDSGEWEVFVSEWMSSQKGKYAEIKRLGGANDHGLDVVGYVDSSKQEGIWDNSQCKHYRTAIPTNTGLIDVAKIIYWSHQGVFKPPRRSRFLAPKGPCGPLRLLLDNPSKLRKAVLEGWDEICAPKITASGVPLTTELKTYVEQFDYGIFGWVHIDEVLNNLKGTGHYVARFGGQLTPPPKASIPVILQSQESKYVRHLLDVYSEDLQQPLSSHDELPEGGEEEADFKRQRERFFEMEHFAHHYRDQTPPNTIEDFVDEIYDSVQPVCAKDHSKSSQRLHEAMAQAAVVKTTSILDPTAKPRVKQGACHHLANEDRLKWKK